MKNRVSYPRFRIHKCKSTKMPWRVELRMSPYEAFPFVEFMAETADLCYDHVGCRLDNHIIIEETG